MLLSLSSMTDRSRLRKDVDIAHDLQIKAGIKGAVQYTGFGLGAVIVAHHSWPLFRRQTFAFKAFLVSAFAMFGLVVAADNVLLKHEAERRLELGAIRKEARIDLARRGIIPTETALREWQAEREKVRELTAENASS